MRTSAALLLLLLLQYCAKAQDTLWIKQQDGHPYLLHKVRSGENLFLLSRRYSAPPAALADANNVNYQDGLPAGSGFLIPVAAYNFIKTEGVAQSRPIYYCVTDEDDLHGISRLFNVTQSTIQRWNRLDLPGLTTGQVLQVGWIAYDRSQVPFADTAAAKTTATLPVKNPQATAGPGNLPVRKTNPVNQAVTQDTLAAGEEEETALQQLYEEQTRAGVQNEESGAGVFFPLKIQAGQGVYYAFHNTAARGTVLRITNPASGKVIYAKVIGSIPALKEYYNSVVGISNNAIPALGATDRRVFCKIKYR